jgi:hypothetical protein
VIARHQEFQLIVVDLVNDAVLGAQAPGPTAAQFKFERFWLSEALEGIAHPVFGDAEKSQGQFAVIADPVLLTQ